MLTRGVSGVGTGNCAILKAHHLPARPPPPPAAPPFAPRSCRDRYARARAPGRPTLPLITADSLPYRSSLTLHRNFVYFQIVVCDN
ncbi:hypothetical protein EVAR_56929_1 [Eumeta japonica]|uniref:Uncharacterized protein n=1 Tax=Eumeta variegata TaxID=151549 RepID=A0A4C1YAW1_EUMVA|nr:hypothetical protein EVAR_56929_1 [Eumeta japonica]